MEQLFIAAQKPLSIVHQVQPNRKHKYYNNTAELVDIFSVFEYEQNKVHKT